MSSKCCRGGGALTGDFSANESEALAGGGSAGGSDGSGMVQGRGGLKSGSGSEMASESSDKSEASLSERFMQRASKQGGSK